MEHIIDWIRPIISGLVGGVAVFIIVFFTKEESKRSGDQRHLIYSKVFKVFSALPIPFSIFVLYAMSQSYQGQEVAAFLVGGGFLASAIFFPYQAFFVKFSYDDEFVYYASPLAGCKKYSWEKLKRVGYSWLIQADYIVVEGIGRIWCSNMLNGYTELMDYLESKKK